jgi:DNA-binding NarL/FixJ family response regulator
MIRILLVDDHAIVRSGYRRLLDAEPGLRVIGEAASASEANAFVQRETPDVALVDLSLKGSSGIEAIRGMRERLPGLRILVLSMHESSGHVTQALRSGAHGYLTKHCEPAEVIEGIRRVAEGERVLAPGMAHFFIDETLDRDRLMARLTPREFEVLRLRVQGESTTAIAVAMNLSPKTILNYLSMIRQKLDADTDFKLLHLAAQCGLVDPPAQETAPFARSDQKSVDGLF